MNSHGSIARSAPDRRRRSRLRTVAIMAAVSGMSLVASLLLLLLVDVFLHHRAAEYAGVNLWGYRGATVSKKQSGELRLVAVGGSTTFGYGVRLEDAYPFLLQRKLQARMPAGRRVSVVNLGMNNQGAYGMLPTLEDYQGLDYDAVILYEGYNDLGGPNRYVARRDSVVFRLTGYYPMLPIYLREKAMVLRAGGNLEAAYKGQTVFRPTLASRTTAAALDAGTAISAALNDQIDRFGVAPQTSGSRRSGSVGCPDRWQSYCESMYEAIGWTVAHHKKVLVVAQPYLTAAHLEQQQALRSMLAVQFAGNTGVKYLDNGSRIDLGNRDLVYDGMHLTASGNDLLAAELVQPVVDLFPEVFADH